MQKALRNPTYICSTCVTITIFFYSLTCILINLLPITQSCLSIPNDVLHDLSCTPNITVSLIVSNYAHGKTHNRKHATLPEIPETNQLRLLLLPKELETNTLRPLLLPPPLRLSWLPPVSFDTHGCHCHHSTL